MDHEQNDFIPKPTFHDELEDLLNEMYSLPIQLPIIQDHQFPINRKRSFPQEENILIYNCDNQSDNSSKSSTSSSYVNSSPAQKKKKRSDNNRNKLRSEFNNDNGLQKCYP